MGGGREHGESRGSRWKGLAQVTPIWRREPLLVHDGVTSHPSLPRAALVLALTALHPGEAVVPEPTRQLVTVLGGCP